MQNQISEFIRFYDLRPCVPLPMYKMEVVWGVILQQSALLPTVEMVRFLGVSSLLFFLHIALVAADNVPRLYPESESIASRRNCPADQRESYHTQATFLLTQICTAVRCLSNGSCCPENYHCCSATLGGGCKGLNLITNHLCCSESIPRLSTIAYLRQIRFFPRLRVTY